MNYYGTIIQESLENNSVLQDVKILSTKVEVVTVRHQTPWVKQWTLHKVEIAETEAESVAQKISKLIDTKHASSWYADYKNDHWHYIIFPHKVFKIDRADALGYAEAKKYGMALGIPEYQVNFAPDVKI